MSLQAGNDCDSQKVERATCSYEDLSSSFKSEKKREFKAQYAHIYFKRLKSMEHSLVIAAKCKWGRQYA